MGGRPVPEDIKPVIQLCQTAEVVQISAVASKLTEQVLIEKYDLKKQASAGINADRTVLYGELFRLCVACNREPFGNEVPKKFI